MHANNGRQCVDHHLRLTMCPGRPKRCTGFDSGGVINYAALVHYTIYTFTKMNAFSLFCFCLRFTWILRLKRISKLFTHCSPPSALVLVFGFISTAILSFFPVSFLIFSFNMIAQQFKVPLKFPVIDLIICCGVLTGLIQLLMFRTPPTLLISHVELRGWEAGWRAGTLSTAAPRLY